MELEDLKTTWDESPDEKNVNTNIMQLIQQQSYGPIAALKATFRKQIVFMSIIPLVLVLTNIQDVAGVFTSIIFWVYVAYCIGMILFAAYNYRVVQRLEVPEGSVKQHLETQVRLLEKRANAEIILMRGVLLLLVLLVEVVPYIQHYRMLSYWHSLPVYVRFGCYGLLVLLQYVMNRRIKYSKVGRHLDRLKSLAEQLK